MPPRLRGMPLTLHPASHLDHGLSPDHIAWILATFANETGFFLRTLDIPPALGPVPSGIYGPIVGDPPVAETDVFYAIRGARKCASRIVRRPSRPSRMLTVIGGPKDEHPCVLFTAYGGPSAPREPGDPSLSTWDEILASRAFWAEHAISGEIVP